MPGESGKIHLCGNRHVHVRVVCLEDVSYGSGCVCEGVSYGRGCVFEGMSYGNGCVCVGSGTPCLIKRVRLGFLVNQ